MKTPQNLPRRKWLQITSLSAITGIAGRIIGKSASLSEDECVLTPRQETGPFEPMMARKQADTDMDLTMIKGKSSVAEGEKIIISGQVMDEECNPVSQAIVEIWQANHHGKYNHEYDTEGKDDPNFQGWGSVRTDEMGKYKFVTILPGLYGGRTRHIHYKVQKRGYHELVTQLYFDGVERNETDGIYNSLTHDEQNKVTVALDENKNGIFNIHLQKVDTNKLPEKVLKPYAGSYRMHYEETPLAGFLTDQLQVKGPVIMTISLEQNQLFIDTSFINKTEIIWEAKDKFDAKYFWDTKFIFNRNSTGEITGFDMKNSPENPGIRFTKV